jgi:hypothetical protein
MLLDEGDMYLLALLSGTGSSSDTMKVLVKLTRHVIIDHGLDSLDVQTTRREVGGHQVIYLSIPERLQSSQTLEGEVRSMYTFKNT